MTPTRSTFLLRTPLRGLAAAACLTVAACASTGGSSVDAEPSAGPAPADVPSPRGTAADGTAAEYVEADVAFMQGMIHHHAQAVVMARMAPIHDPSPAVGRLCARILNSQKTEIALMADWLRDRGETVPEYASVAEEPARGEGPGPIDGWDEGPQMPGILSDAQMARLDAARGQEFDRLFLTFMIDHHQGAVDMVNRLVAQPLGAREESVFRLASGIRSDQEIEIERMRQMLRELLIGSGSP